MLIDLEIHLVIDLQTSIIYECILLSKKEI